MMLCVYMYLSGIGMVFTNNKYPFCFLFFSFFYALLSQKEKEKSAADGKTAYLPTCLPTYLSVPTDYLA